MNKQGIMASALVVGLIMGGCSSTGNVAETQQQAQYRNEQFLLAQTAIEALEQRLAQAKQDNLFYFSPDPYEDALSEYADANDDYEDIRFDPSRASAGNTQDILGYVQQANLKLDAAWQIKATIETTLEDSFEQFKRLDELGVPKLYSREYSRSKKKLDNLVEYIAEGNIAKAQDRQADLLLTLSALEIQAVKEIQLSRLVAGIQGLKKARIERVAPNSFQKAVIAKERAEAVIAASPRDSQGISAAVKPAIFELEHAQNMMLEVKKLRAIDKKGLESYIVGGENQLAKISQALGLGDIRNLTLKKQVELLTEKATATLTLTTEQVEKLTQLEKTIEEKNNLLLMATGDKDKLNNEMLTQLADKDNQLSILTLRIEQFKTQADSLNLALVESAKKLTEFEAATELSQAKLSAEQANNQLTAQKDQLENENKLLKVSNQLVKLQTELAAVKANNLQIESKNKILKNELDALGKTATDIKTTPAS